MFHWLEFGFLCRASAQNGCLAAPFALSPTPKVKSLFLLGTVAIRTPDTLLEWDAGAMKIPNHAKAGQLRAWDERDKPAFIRTTWFPDIP